MALDFPANPVNNQVYGSYVYNSTVGAWQAREESAAVVITSPTKPTTANNGDLWYNTSTGITYVYFSDGTSSQWVEIVTSGLPAVQQIMPTGSIIQTALPSAPTGWLFCQGQEILISAYQSLYTAMTVGGTVFSYGSNTNGSGGIGTTHFRLPDLRGRIPVGQNSGTFASIGSVGGAESVTLTAAQSGVPAHSHPNTLTDPSHSHPPASGYISYLQNTYPTANTHNVAGGGGYISPNVTSTGSATTGITINNANNSAANASQAHTNLQPYIVLNHMIKV